MAQHLVERVESGFSLASPAPHVKSPASLHDICDAQSHITDADSTIPHRYFWSTSPPTINPVSTFRRGAPPCASLSLSLSPIPKPHHLATKPARGPSTVRFPTDLTVRGHHTLRQPAGYPNRTWDSPLPYATLPSVNSPSHTSILKGGSTAHHSIHNQSHCCIRLPPEPQPPTQSLHPYTVHSAP